MLGRGIYSFFTRLAILYTSISTNTHQKHTVDTIYILFKLIQFEFWSIQTHRVLPDKWKVRYIDIIIMNYIPRSLVDTGIVKVWCELDSFVPYSFLLENETLSSVHLKGTWDTVYHALSIYSSQCSPKISWDTLVIITPDTCNGLMPALFEVHVMAWCQYYFRYM